MGTSAGSFGKGFRNYEFHRRPSFRQENRKFASASPIERKVMAADFAHSKMGKSWRLTRMGSFLVKKSACVCVCVCVCLFTANSEFRAEGDRAFNANGEFRTAT